ncbi:flagellar biosynthesis anti-sigma factor FlgM [Paenibacillus marinisediminis]
MKINDTQRIGAAQQYQRQSALQRTTKPSARKDEVSISTEAKEMLDAQNKVQDTNRASRIQELKQAVSTGTYHVDAEKVAEKLLPIFRRYSE